MKKIILLIILLLPFYVYAEDSCSQDDIQIESIVLDSTQGNIEQTSKPNTDNNSINLGLKANVIDDNATYKVVIKNISNQDYVFDKSSLSTDYLNYDITYEDNSDIVKAGESKTIYLKVHYATKPSTESLSNGVVTTQPKVTFNLQKEEEVKTIIEEVVNAITNPNTNDKVLIYLGILVISLITTIVLLRKYKKAKLTTMLIITFLITTQIVKAVCTCTLNVNTELEIDAKEAIFLPGQEVNVKMKQLAGDDTSQSDNPQFLGNQTITYFKYSEAAPSEENKTVEHIVSTPESGYPIYMWFDNGTIYWWSEDKTPSLNENSSYMFSYLKKLNNTDGLINIDASNTKQMQSFLYYTMIEDVDSLSKWNTSNLLNMNTTFAINDNLTSLEGLSYWDTSNVEDMTLSFSSNKSLTTLAGLENWNTSKVTTIAGAFYNTSIKNFTALKKWDTSQVQNLSLTFAYNDVVESLEGIEDWDTSNVNTLESTFYSNDLLSDISALAKWDTSKVKSLKMTFGDNKSLISLISLKDWDTSSVQNMEYVFSRDSSLTSLEGLEDWNVSNVTNLASAFLNSNYIESLEPLKKWDTSNITNFTSTFQNLVTITSLNGLEDWNMSNAQTLTIMFHNCSKLTDASALKNWDVSNVVDFSYMFSISNAVLTTEKYSALPELDLSNWNMSSAKRYNYFLESLRYVTSEFTIRSTNITNFASMLEDCANEGGQVTVNYTADTEDIVDQMIATKSANGNIVKGVLKE